MEPDTGTAPEPILKIHAFLRLPKPAAMADSAQLNSSGSGGTGSPKRTSTGAPTLSGKEQMMAQAALPGQLLPGEGPPGENGDGGDKPFPPKKPDGNGQGYPPEKEDRTEGHPAESQDKAKRYAAAHFDELQHPRGQPNNAGQFVAKVMGVWPEDDSRQGLTARSY
jgi:hypothetical protein